MLTTALLYRVTCHSRLTPLASFSFARSVTKPPQPPSDGKPAPKKLAKSSDFEVFDPSKSKYGLPREEQVRQTAQKRGDAPEYLKNEQKYQEFTQKEYRQENPVVEVTGKGAGVGGSVNDGKKFKMEDAKKNR